MPNILSKIARDPAWAARKTYLWSRSIAALRADDVIFAFYPKTGSTWVRIFFFNLLRAKAERDGGFNFDELDSTMPEFANPSFFSTWPFTDCPRLIKTHQTYLPIFKRNRAILFTREPRDTMVSFLHFANAQKEINFSGNLDDLVRHHELGLKHYFRFHQSWLPHAGMVLRYEDLRADPVREFKRLVEFLGLDADDSTIRTAIDASSLEQTRKAQQRSSEQFQKKLRKGFVFARKGTSGEGRHLFDQRLETFYRDLRKAHSFTLYPE